MRHWAAKLSPCCAKERSATPSRPPLEPPARRSCSRCAEPAFGASSWAATGPVLSGRPGDTGAGPA
eukprot:6852498-Heterocapsa_arctica.AAC.1